MGKKSGCIPANGGKGTGVQSIKSVSSRPKKKKRKKEKKDDVVAGGTVPCSREAPSWSVLCSLDVCRSRGREPSVP